MSDILHANIFFFITAIATVVVTVLLCVVLYYVAGILRSVRNVTRRIERGSEVLGKDLIDLRRSVEHDGMRLRHIITFFGKRAGWYPETSTKRKTRVHKDKKEEEVSDTN